jgi:hypothetical protein
MLEPMIKAQALREAADILSRLEYVRPNAAGREEYERMLAIRRGWTDKWLKELADQIEQEDHNA